MAVYCHAVWPFLHVTKERPKTLAPAFANCNAASSVVFKLMEILVCASLDQLPPTVVRRFVAIASQCLTITQFSLRVIADAAAQYATREANGSPGVWVFHSPPYVHPAHGLHLDSSTFFRHSFATGASATRGVAAAKIRSPDRHLAATLTQANKKRLALTHPLEAQNGQLAIFVSGFILESSSRLTCHECGENLPSSK